MKANYICSVETRQALTANTAVKSGPNGKWIENQVCFSGQIFLRFYLS